MQHTVDKVRLDFFNQLFDDAEGLLCIATTHNKRGKPSFKRFFFQWPDNKNEALALIRQKEPAHNVWFSTALFVKQDAHKEYALASSQIVWADLDTTDPNDVSPKPPIVIQSSPGRFQALWTLDEAVPVEMAENFSKRIAYKYQPSGTDTSGWDIGQLLRVPFTFNWKEEYRENGERPPTVDLLHSIDMAVPVSLFEALENPITTKAEVGSDLPDDIPADPQAVIDAHIDHMDNPVAFVEIYEEEPEEGADWSRRLWRLIHMCFESGMTDTEAFAVARASKCNKYARDSRPEKYLWLEVLKAKTKHVRLGEYKHSSTFNMPQIIDTDIELPYTFIDMYREQAAKATDAPVEFHNLGAFMILSCLLAGSLKIEANHGTIHPNLWGLTLGASTLTRKTTSMRMAMNVVAKVDDAVLLASDGSFEGIITALALRNGKPSVFFRDEISGFFDAIGKREYLSGIQEAFTQLYDVPPFFKRQLRKETIMVRDPLFIFYGGGIQEKTYEVLNEQSVTSGFLPRFLIVGGETPLDQLQDIGPPTGEQKDLLEDIDKLAYEMHNTYVKSNKIKITGKDGIEDIDKPIVTNVLLDTESWTRFASIERTMVTAGHNTGTQAMALPTMQRLARSLLKMATLVAASRQEPTDENEIQMQVSDIDVAASYVQKWGQYSIDAVMNVGRGVSERKSSSVRRAIERKPGIQRSEIMRHFHMSKRDMDDVIATLIDRGEIRQEKVNKGHSYYPEDL